MPGANIITACLAKRVGTPTAVILAGHVKSGHIKPVLSPSLLSIVDPPDASSSFRVACPLGKKPYMIAVLSDENGSDLCAVCIVSGRTIQNIGAVFSCLEEMKERFDMALEEDGGDADSLLAGNSGQVSRDVASLVAKYNDPNVETIQKLKNQMKDVQASLSSAIAVLMLRGDKLNELLDNAEDLAKKAGDIEVVGRQLYCKMLWRYWKWVLMIVLGLLIFIGIVVAIACSAEKC